MKTKLTVQLALGVLLLALAAGSTAGAAPAKENKPAKAAKPPPGYQAAETISMLTGVAISPLLGVGAVGCYQYWKAPADQRAQLHWYAQPWFWAPALLLVALVALKDTLGPATPTVLKKPMDVAEAVENKISGLVAAGAFVPLVTEFFPSAAGTDATALVLGGAGFASLDLASLFNFLSIPFAMAAFALVWLAAHAINILILISPFTTVDTALKAFRAFLLSLVVATHWIDPYLGALFSLLVILFSYFIAGWSYRLLVMGAVFIWDYLTLRRLRFTPAANGNWMFSAVKLPKTPVRTYGRLHFQEGGKLIFEYRPWLFLPRRKVELPPGKYVVGRGIFFPEIFQDQNEESLTVFTLPPRYRTHEEDLARAYSLGPAQDIGLLKGIKAVWRWVKGLFGFKSPAPAHPAPA